MNREAAWKMLDKPLRSVLVYAAHEEEPPAADEDEDTPTPRRSNMNRPRGRMRRGGRGAGQSHTSWLPSPQAVIDETPYSTAFQLATLLIHKQMDADEWDEAWNENETALRETCMSEGVHPVWHLVGEKTVLLSQFLAFPKAKAKQQSKKKAMGTSFFNIDPRDRSELLTVLKLASAGAENPETKVALQKVTNQVSGHRKVALGEHLMGVKDSLAFVTFLVMIHAGQPVTKAISNACKKADETLHSALEDLANLMSGKVNDWAGTLAVEGDDSLTKARHLLAWEHAPNDAESLTSSELEAGITLLSEAGVSEAIDRLTWWRLKALHREKNDQEALDVLEGLRLDVHSDVVELLPLIISLDDQRANDWLLSFLPDLDEQAWFHIISEVKLVDPIRLAAAKALTDLQGHTWADIKSTAIHLLMEGLDIERLARVISTDSMLPLSHPYVVLFVCHIAPARLPYELREHLGSSREQALQAIHGAEVPAVLTPIAEHLLLLMEGIYKDTPELAAVFNTTAMKAFSPISRALTSDGVVSHTHIKNMGNSLDELDISPIERRLFDAMLLSLTMNGYLQRYHIGMAQSEDAEAINAMMDDQHLPMRLMDSFAFLVVEHDLGLSGVVEWYQQHDPRSPWAPLARAALFASNGDELNSAREYTRAAELFSAQRHNTKQSDQSGESDDDDTAIALPLALYRKALIHYAHAQQYSEAVSLMQKVPALKTAITERFKLYLNVCHTASKDTDAATRLVRSHVQMRKTYTEEDVEGNLIEKSRTVYNEEELDLLRNYPYEKSHILPPEPFLGRVTAASTRISRDLRRSRSQIEQQFRQIMQSSSPTMNEIYELAKGAAEEGAFEGLMYLERAQNSSKFSASDRRRLAGVEQSLFSQYKDNITTSKRRFLRNLSLAPLVIIDTNILVDALVERVYQHMKLVFETNLNILGSNRFHHILLHHATEKRLFLMIPDDVRGELKQFAKDNRLMHRFQGAMVDADTLKKTLSEDVMLSLVDEVLDQYSTWTPTSEMLSELPSSSEQLDAFLKHHADVFADLTSLKQMRGITYRTTLDNKEIYPEETDLDIYRLAMHLASQPLPDIGSVLVATMDGDFTLLDRAIEEKFGFSVTKNHRTLKPWLKH